MMVTPRGWVAWLSATHATEGDADGESPQRTVLASYQRRKGQPLGGRERVVAGHQGGQLGERVQPEQAAGEGVIVAHDVAPRAAPQVGDLQATGQGGPYVVVDAVADVQEGA